MTDTKWVPDVRYRLALATAESLLEIYPNSAHLYALEKVHANENPNFWRQVLIELDRLQGEKNASTELQKTRQHRT